MNKMAAATVLLFFVLPTARANVTPSFTNPIGSLGIDTPLLTEADAIPTGNIATATTFMLQSLATTHNTSGIFAGLPKIGRAHV